MDEEIQMIYRNNVPKVQVPVSHLCHSNFSPSRTFERNPYFANLEQSVFSKLLELVPDEKVEEKLPEYKNNGISQISVEDAIRELLELEAKQ